MTRAAIAMAMSLVLAACASPPAAGPGPTEDPAAVAEPSPTEVVAPTPKATPEGTPAPIPVTPSNESAEIVTPSPAPRAKPTPSPEPGLWRIQGYVVDEDGKPLDAVCVVIGPNGCQPFSLRTDQAGHWFIDVGDGGGTGFNFYFEMPGRQTVWWQVRPQGPMEHNVILKRSE